MGKRSRRLDVRQAGRRILIVFGVVAVLNAGFYLALVRPTVGEYRRLSDERDPFRPLNDRRDGVARNEDFLATVQRTEQDLAELREAILSSRNARMVDVHEELAALCDQFGIDLDSVNIDNEILIESELDRMTMHVPLEGNYQNLRKFLLATENSDQFLLVERVSLAKGKQGGVGLSLSIQLSTYFNAPEGVVTRKRALQRRGRQG